MVSFACCRGGIIRGKKERREDVPLSTEKERKEKGKKKREHMESWKGKRRSDLLSPADRREKKRGKVLLARRKGVVRE